MADYDGWAWEDEHGHLHVDDPMGEEDASLQAMIYELACTKMRMSHGPGRWVPVRLVKVEEDGDES